MYTKTDTISTQTPFTQSANFATRTPKTRHKTPEFNEPQPMNIHVLHLTMVILKRPVPHFT